MSNISSIMDSMPSIGGQTLESLAERINASQGIIKSMAVDMVSEAAKAGELLIEAKSKVNHGEWGNWVKENLTFGSAQATRYMVIGANPELRANLALKHDFKSIEAMSNGIGKMLKGEEPKALPKPKPAETVLQNRIDELEATVATLKSEGHTAHPDATQEQINELSEALCLIVAPTHIDRIRFDDYAQQAIVNDYHQIVALMENTSKAMSKKAMTFFIKLLKYQQVFFRKELERKMPEEIKKTREQLARREKELKRGEKLLAFKKAKVKDALDSKEIKRIYHCLSPDRESTPEMRTEAFKSFQKLETGSWAR